jgi:hypothetical protein
LTRRLSENRDIQGAYPRSRASFISSFLDKKTGKKFDFLPVRYDLAVKGGCPEHATLQGAIIGHCCSEARSIAKLDAAKDQRCRINNRNALIDLNRNAGTDESDTDQLLTGAPYDKNRFRLHCVVVKKTAVHHY